MVVRARGLQLVAAGDELFTEGLRIRDNLLGIRLPCRLSRLQERGSDTRDGVVVRATLAGREDGVIDTLLEVGSLFGVLAEENKTSARATEGLVPEG